MQTTVTSMANSALEPNNNPAPQAVNHITIFGQFEGMRIYSQGNYSRESNKDKNKQDDVFVGA